MGLLLILIIFKISYQVHLKVRQKYNYDRMYDHLTKILSGKNILKTHESLFFCWFFFLFYLHKIFTCKFSVTYNLNKKLL